MHQNHARQPGTRGMYLTQSGHAQPVSDTPTGYLYSTLIKPGEILTGTYVPAEQGKKGPPVADTPHRTGYMRAITQAHNVTTQLAVNRVVDSPSVDTIEAIRARLREFEHLYEPPTGQTRDTVEAGYRDGQLAVADALAQAHLDARHHARCTGGDIYAVTRFFDDLEARLTTKKENPQ